MAEHEHEWRLRRGPPDGTYWVFCISTFNCTKTMTLEEVESRLNEYTKLKKATNRLSAKMARRCLGWPGQVFDAEAYAALESYADTLEGK